jgi:hypothetical protein
MPLPRRLRTVNLLARGDVARAFAPESPIQLAPRSRTCKRGGGWSSAFRRFERKAPLKAGIQPRTGPRDDSWMTPTDRSSFFEDPGAMPGSLPDAMGSVMQSQSSLHGVHLGHQSFLRPGPVQSARVRARLPAAASDAGACSPKEADPLPRVPFGRRWRGRATAGPPAARCRKRRARVGKAARRTGMWAGNKVGGPGRLSFSSGTMVPGACSFPARRCPPRVAPATKGPEVPSSSHRRKRRKRRDGGGRPDADPAGRIPELPYRPPIQTAITVGQTPLRAGTGTLRLRAPIQTAKKVARPPLRRGQPHPLRPATDANGENGGPASAADGDRRTTAPGADANGF